MSGLLLGLDPGGKGAFGWALAEDAPAWPLRVVRTGTADSAREALDAALGAAGSTPILAAGIDAPLHWVAEGDRAVDARLRKRIAELGAPHPAGTVQHVNSLRGACLVQGMAAALLLRERFPALPISEAHPKALLWLLGIAAPGVPASSIGFEALAGYLALAPGEVLDRRTRREPARARGREAAAAGEVPRAPGGAAPLGVGPAWTAAPRGGASEHARDAALATLAARAALHAVEGWSALAPLDPAATTLSPLSPPRGYWLPLGAS